MPRNSQALSGLNACMGCGDIAFPVLAPKSRRNMVTQGIHIPKPLPQSRFFCIKPLCKCALSPGKRQYWSKFGKVPFSARMVPLLPVARTPRLHLKIFTQADWFWQMCLLCMAGAGNGASAWAAKQIGHIWKCLMVGRTSISSGISLSFALEIVTNALEPQS